MSFPTSMAWGLQFSHCVARASHHYLQTYNYSGVSDLEISVCEDTDRGKEVKKESEVFTCVF